MKRIICIVLIYSVIFLLCGCDNVNEENIEKKGFHEVQRVVYNFTRARARKDKKIIKKYIPDIIDNKEGKEKYMDKIKSIDKYNIKSLGIEYLKYTIMNVGERKKILALLEKEYGIDEDYVNEIKETGYVTFDIKYADYKGKEGKIKVKNIVYMYKNDYYMIIYKESKKRE